MRLTKLLTAAIAAIGLVGSAHAAGGVKHPHGPDDGWSFEGPLGTFDQGQLQRGYKVYREVCAACHGMELLSYRNLGQVGGPFYDENYPNPNDNPVVKQIASEFSVRTIDEETGDELDENNVPLTRPAITSDAFASPYANDAAARAVNGGALPPDLSVINKARHGGASYIYSLLTGYPSDEKMEKDYAELSVTPGQYYNPYFSGDTSGNWSGDPRYAPYGGFLAMAPPLLEGQVDYDDGTEATVSQMAQDVAIFLAWAGEPKQTVRKQLGLSTMIYLLILTVLVYFSYRRIWRNVEH
ncbi:MAG: cytochrome c1 [Pseudomonadota bacterium]